MKNLLACLALSALATGCALDTADVGETSAPAIYNDQAAGCPTDSTLNYANFGQQFMEEHPDIDFIAVFTDGAPQYELNLSAAEAVLLGEWLACGAP